MRLNRYGIASLAGAAVLVAGGGTALAGKGGSGDKAARCQERLARIADRRGATVEQLQADVKARLLARVDAALAANRITSERAAKLKDRIQNASFCSGALRQHVRHGVHHLLRAAAGYLELTPAQLRAQLQGTSLAALAKGQGKSVDGLEAAMLALAKDRLAKAVAGGAISQPQADRRLVRLQELVAHLVSRTFPAK